MLRQCFLNKTKKSYKWSYYFLCLQNALHNFAVIFYAKSDVKALFAAYLPSYVKLLGKKAIGNFLSGLLLDKSKRKSDIVFFAGNKNPPLTFSLK